jgi:signal transduction histidine kinase
MYQDEIKFRQIVANLIKNALHHRDERIEIRMVEEEGYLLFEVTDDGPGVEPEHHKMIFQRYRRVNDDATSNRKGHGLGLAGALISARSIGGNIEIKSHKGIGATFRLVLPMTLGEGFEKNQPMGL